MQTIILAGGKGTRLKPYTTVLPKPLMPIGDMPILEIVVKQLKYYGCNKIIMAVGHLKELLIAFFNSGRKWDMEIKYSFEDKPLGTAGPLRLINSDDLEDNFIVMNGDVLTDLNFGEFFKFHKGNGALCTIATYKKPVKINLGVIESENNILTNYIEKPTLNYTVSMGVYAFRKETLKYIPNNEYFDFPDLIQTLIKEKEKVISYNFENFWLDIGTPSDFEIATDTFEKQTYIFKGIMKIAITGSSGFTGQKLVKFLESQNHEIIKIDLEDGIDITDYNNLKNIPEFEVIFHLAARSFVPESYEDPQEFYRMNFNSTLNTLELSKKYNAKYIFISSYVYGQPKYLPIDENHPIQSFNPYADTKILGENLCISYNKFFDLNVIIVRPFNIYGPHQTHNFLVPFIFNQAFNGLIELNDPNPRRDLIYIDDLIELYASLIEFNKSSLEIFNAGYGKSYPVKEIVDYIIDLFPSRVEVKYLNKKRPNEVLDTIANIEKAKDLLDWVPKVDLRDGLLSIYSSMKM